MGERADKGAVRDGEDALVVSGRFYQEGLDPADPASELVAVRRVGADGRSRVSIDGRMAGVGELADAVAPAIDLCGQHEHQRLMKPASHVRMLDAWGGRGGRDGAGGVRKSVRPGVETAAELDRVREAGEASSAKLDEARFVLARIDAVGPREGEYDDLAADLARVENAEALATAANAAHEALAGEGGALDALNAAASALDGAARHDAALGALAESLREAGYVLGGTCPARRATTATTWSSTRRRSRNSKSAWRRSRAFCARTARACPMCWPNARRRPTWCRW